MGTRGCRPLSRVVRIGAIGTLQAILYGMMLAPAASAQVAPEPVIAGTYSSFSLITQIPGTWTERPEVIFSWGRLLARGSGGRLLLRGDAVGGLVAGPFFLDGVLAGPAVSLAHVFPGEYLQVASRSFAEFYPVLGGIGYVYGFWRADPGDPLPGIHFVPSMFVGAGVRVYERGTVNPGFETVDFAYEVRSGYGTPRLLIRLSRHRPLRARR